MIIHLSCDEPPNQPVYVGAEPYPRHVKTKQQRAEWTDAVVKGIEERDPFAPRLSPFELIESAAKSDLTMDEFTWAMYAPLDTLGHVMPFSPHLTVEQAHYLFKDPGAADREHRRNSAKKRAALKPPAHRAPGRHAEQPRDAAG